MKNEGSKSTDMRVWISLFVMSLSVVAFEIHLMHFYSVVQWQHFASMVISIALLGFGTSGTLISVFRNWMLKNSQLLIPLFMMTSGVLMLTVLPLSRIEFFRLDTFTLFAERTQFLKLSLNYLLFFLPFLFAALSIGLVFVKKASKIGNYYFADLVGAGFGGLLAIGLLWVFNLTVIPLIVSVLPVFAGLLYLERKRKKEYIVLISYALVCFGTLLLSWNHPADMKPSPYKSISYALNLPEAEIEATRHSPYGLLQVVSSPYQRFAPGLSLSSPIDIPSTKAAFNNGNWYAPLPGSGKAVQVLDYTTMALPFKIREIQSLLQLGAGAGFEARYALEQGVQRIDAIESHGVLLDLLAGTYAELTDSIFFDPGVHWNLTSPRSFLERSDSHYDLIQLPLLGNFGGSVGLNAMEEDWVLTREGFQAIWNRLDERGMLVVSCWIDMPQKMSIRLGALISNLCQENGIRGLQDHLVIIRSWGTLTFLLSKSELSIEEHNSAQNYGINRQFDLVPSDRKIDRNETFNLIQDPYFDSNLRLSLGSSRDSLLTHFPFNVKVPTDNKPYFFQNLKLSQWNEQKARWGDSRTAFLELGYLLMLITFAQLLIFAFLLVLLPLFKLRKTSSGIGRVLLYFSSLGIGFMFLEMVMIKYFSLYLGHPIYSAATVISVMLICSGLGSKYSEKIGPGSKFHMSVITLIILVAVIYSLILGPLLSMSLGWPFTVRLMMTLLIIGIPAFFMGMPFPLGLKILDRTRKGAVAWAWGVNGFASVISVSLAVILSVELGFVAVLLISSIAYITALLSARTLA